MIPTFYIWFIQYFLFVSCLSSELKHSPYKCTKDEKKNFYFKFQEKTISTLWPGHTIYPLYRALSAIYTNNINIKNQ